MQFSDILQRNLRQLSLPVKSLAYLTYMRSILEYASMVWPPYAKTHIMTLEKIQLRTAHFVCNNYSNYNSVTSMLDMLNWLSLGQRRRLAKCMYHVLKLTYVVSVDLHQYLKSSLSRTRGHDTKFIQLQTRVELMCSCIHFYHLP